MTENIQVDACDLWTIIHDRALERSQMARVHTLIEKLIGYPLQAMHMPGVMARIMPYLGAAFPLLTSQRFVLDEEKIESIRAEIRKMWRNGEVTITPMHLERIRAANTCAHVSALELWAVLNGSSIVDTTEAKYKLFDSVANVPLDKLAKLSTIYPQLASIKLPSAWSNTDMNRGMLIARIEKVLLVNQVQVLRDWMHEPPASFKLDLFALWIVLTGRVYIDGQNQLQDPKVQKVLLAMDSMVGRDKTRGGFDHQTFLQIVYPQLLRVAADKFTQADILRDLFEWHGATEIVFDSTSLKAAFGLYSMQLMLKKETDGSPPAD